MLQLLQSYYLKGKMTSKSIYQELEPAEDLREFVHSFWTHQNLSDHAAKMTIVPDSFFKIIFYVRNERILNYFMTGLWTTQKEITIPAHTTVYGCRFKILAPEFLLKTEMATLLDQVKQLDTAYLNVNTYDFSSLKSVVIRWQTELRKIKSVKKIEGNKLRLSHLIYATKNKPLTAAEVSGQIYWTNRQISRYLNRYLGVSLRKYLNIQKIYASYIQIREGRFYPEHSYFDQAHFIKQVKQHTGETPTTLHEGKNDRFVQLKNIRGK